MNIDIEKLKQRKQQAEEEIAAQLQRIVSEFEKDTGISIQGVRVYAEEVTSFGDQYPKYIISKAELEIKLL